MTTDQHPQTLHEAFEQTAQRYPGRIAVVDSENRLTYAELDRRANRVASMLRKRGLSGTLIGLSTARSVDVVIGILAILKAGAAYVPLDPELPTERRHYIAGESGMRAVIVDTRGSASDNDGLLVMALDEADDADSDPVPSSLATGSDAAYVIYTSGSTGLPKGVVVEHRQVLSLFEAANDVFDIGPTDVWTLFHSYAFDFSVWEMFGAILHGGCVVVVPADVARSPEAMWRLIRREGVTVLNQTPSYFAQFSSADPGFSHSLRYIVFGGEALEFSRLQNWYKRYGESSPRLVNMYGITETTVHVTQRPLSPSDVTAGRSLIGKALSHLSIRLLDHDLRPVPVGEVGEICVGGTGLARGYLGDPELTRKRFVQAPDDGTRLYRSGDLGRLLENGDIEYVGRSDDQVKVRGYRIEPGEIQQRLRQHERIADAVVVTRQNPDAGTRLVAYYVAAANAHAPSTVELRAFLGLTLPDYMIPGWFVQLDALPLNHNGKLDRSALPDRSVIGRCQSALSEVAENAAELDAIWREVLEVEDIAEDERFQTLGGDSIQAIRIASRARALGIPVEVEDLFTNPTFGDLLKVISDRKVATPRSKMRADGLLSPADRAAIPAGVEDAYPLTMLQMGMLFHSSTSEAKTLYHGVSYATVNLPFAAERLRACIASLVRRHDTLRTSFNLKNFSQPLQLVHEDAKPDFDTADLTALDQQAQDAAVAALLDHEEERPLDWAQAPMIRFKIAVLGPERFLFIWSAHHAILDGWSNNSLFAEFMADYTNVGADLTQPAPMLREYVAAEQAAVASEEFRTFWADYLDGISTTVGPDAGEQGTHTVALDLPDGAYQRLADTTRTAGLTPKTLLSAVVATALAAHRGRHEVIIGQATHGRPDHPDGERALGLFLNVLPLRVDVSGTWLDVARAIDAAAQATNPYRRYPLAAVRQAARLEFQLDNAINFTDFRQVASLVRHGLINSGSVRSRAATSFPLVVDTERRSSDGELGITLQFQAAQWPASAQAAFSELLGTAVRRALKDLNATAMAFSREAEPKDFRGRTMCEGRPAAVGHFASEMGPSATPAAQDVCLAAE